MLKANAILKENLVIRGLGFFLTFLVGVAPHAEVVSSNAAGFVSTHKLKIATPTEKVFVALTDDIDKWWDASHSYSGKAENFYLEARALGCFCEKLGTGGSVAHMQVLFVKANEELRLGGGLGPLQGIGASGTMIFKLVSDSENETILHYRYSVSGYLKDGLASWAEPVDQVQLGQLLRLKHYVEHGSPE